MLVKCSNSLCSSFGDLGIDPHNHRVKRQPQYFHKSIVARPTTTHRKTKSLFLVWVVVVLRSRILFMRRATFNLSPKIDSEMIQVASSSLY